MGLPQELIEESSYTIKAVANLYKYGYVDSLSELKKLLPSNERGKATLKAIEDINETKVKLLINRLFTAKSGEPHAPVVHELAKLGDTAIEKLINSLSNPDERVRKRAARILGELGSNVAVDPLIKKLEDPNERVRTNAAKALYKIGDKRAINSLVNRLNDPCPHVRGASLEALGKLGNPSLIKKLVPMLDDPDDRVKHDAIKSLTRLGYYSKFTGSCTMG
jgi:HEAT repeat protein